MPEREALYKARMERAGKLPVVKNWRTVALSLLDAVESRESKIIALEIAIRNLKSSDAHIRDAAAS